MKSKNYTKDNMIKKVVKWLLIITMCLYLSYIAFILFFFCDNFQYKQIGDTHFYLLHNGSGQESLLYHDGGDDDVFYPINHEGFVHDVYWNQQVIIAQCNQHKEEHWYIIRNIKDYNYPEFKIKHILNEMDYRRFLDSLGMDEKSMKHTDGTIPWRIHF